MLLTRFVRIQLVIFTVASIIGMTVMVFSYLQVPALWGIGHLKVTVQLPRSGGLYQFSNVTYRGVQVGKVIALTVRDGRRVDATLSLDSAPKISADLTAAVRSVSAVGEQYLDLQPRNESPPYLKDGSVIPIDRTSMPQPVGPMLDKISALVDSIPKDRLGDLLDESFTAFNGAGYDIGSLADSSSRLTADFNDAADQTRTLIDASGPLLDSQVQSTDELRTWAHALAGVTGQIAHDDRQVRTILRDGPGAANEASRLLSAVKPTLPVLLANLTTIGQVAVTYHPSLEQILVLLPPQLASIMGATPQNNSTGIPPGDFAATISDPPACTVGFLPPSQWRSPADFTDIDTPDGLYCKLPQDSPIAVRGARNYPCMGKPGKRAPTVQICDSDQPYMPLAMRQHVLGPAPLDPNLLSQGIPPDDRVTFPDHIFGPVQGTPLPPGAAPAGAPPQPPPGAVPGQAAPGPPAMPGNPPPPQGGDAPAPLPGEESAVPGAAPSAFPSRQSAGGPSIAVARYDRSTGAYMAPDGHLYRQADLVAPTAAHRSWKDLILGAP